MIMFYKSIAKASDYSGNLDAYNVIATLGPTGTSSENTALFFGTKMRSKPKIKLFDTYEDAEHFIFSSQHSLMLVANAYKRINEFYISDRTNPLLSFFFNTPPYGIATKTGVDLTELNRERILHIASHHAPKHLIAKLLPNHQFNVLDAASTSLAAKMVAKGEVDACLTTKIACEKEGLVLQSHEVDIQMLWTAFTKKVQQ
ncbi:bacilysin biosynthesis protein BacA [Solimicrobium silvestre]|uniref:Prephenate dehydratase n=1 Tax=Solimicrobium silvestre TaxID=2099400 RepID=A0A2S9GX83_9BURK|nr:bacilysin biosynthesis protein BacA [Solimicrobium silvestre]PRC92329.1 Prephenate dehydratase [Solimicrobium silvestre]